MANTLTDLAPDIMIAMDRVGRELTGFISSVTMNSGSETAAMNDTVRSHATRKVVVNNTVTPSMTIPEGDDQTVDSKTLELDLVARTSIPWEGEEQRHVNNGIGFTTIYGDQIMQAMRGITNQIEAHIGQVAVQGASRAVGTAGTAPFDSDFGLVNEARQVIADNGQWVDDQTTSLVVSTTAGTNLRNITNLQRVDASGNDELLRQGTLLDLSGAMIKESAGVYSHTRGTGNGFLVNNGGGHAIDAASLAADTGTGTILAGDIVTLAGDSNKYVVNEALSAGSFAIGDPGLREAVADNAAITVGANYVGNVMLRRDAIELAMRPLAKPEGGDSAVDTMIMEDPRSGLVYQISDYRGYYKALFDITVLYKAKVWNPDGIALVLG